MKSSFALFIVLLFSTQALADCNLRVDATGEFLFDNAGPVTLNNQICNVIPEDQPNMFVLECGEESPILIWMDFATVLWMEQGDYVSKLKPACDPPESD